MLGKDTNVTRVTSIVLAVLLITGTAALPATVAADHDDGGVDTGFLDGLVNNNGSSVVDSATAFVGGILDRVSYLASQQNPFASDDTTTTAAQEAHDVQTYFNSNNQSFIDYVNNQSVGDSSTDVWEITIEQDKTETIYLVATYNNTSNAYESAQIVNSTSRTVDETVTLEDYAAANVAEELKYFHSNYVTEGTAADSAYRRRLAAKYAGDIESSIPEDEE